MLRIAVFASPEQVAVWTISSRRSLRAACVPTLPWSSAASRRLTVWCAPGRTAWTLWRCRGGIIPTCKPLTRRSIRYWRRTMSVWWCWRVFCRSTSHRRNWTGRVMNIHPALLPAFGGKGFYGDRVHQAVLDSGGEGERMHGSFRCDSRYDHGPIILQTAVPVLDDDTIQSLAARVFVADVRGLSAGYSTICR